MGPVAPLYQTAVLDDPRRFTVIPLPGSHKWAVFDCLVSRHCVIFTSLDHRMTRQVCRLCKESVDGVNLDAMPPSDLLALSEFMVQSRHHAAFLLWQKDDETAAGWIDLLRRYAQTKYMAMEHRLCGEIQKALQYENRCDDYYERLPPEVRTW